MIKPGDWIDFDRFGTILYLYDSIDAFEKDLGRPRKVPNTGPFFVIAKILSNNFSFTWFYVMTRTGEFGWYGQHEHSLVVVNP
jgi:hypothetical protein